ncbi:MAG: HDOD domain-containing protein [Deltaproteobacteria bacterium]|nr:HDOD domain-containing protein [Deltaproteobacteria bacterium]
MGNRALVLTCKTTGEPKLLERVERIENLPVPSNTFFKLRQTAREQNVDLRRLAVVIEEKPALAANLVKIANTAYFDRAKRVDSIEEVIHVMGVKAVIDMVLTLELVRGFGLPKGLDIERYWDHAAAVAMLAEDLTAAGETEKKTAYEAGLLHDLGLLMMARFFPVEFKLLVGQLESGGTVYETMPALFGCSHIDLSVALARRWGLEPELIRSMTDLAKTKAQSEITDDPIALVVRRAHRIAEVNRYAFYWDTIADSSVSTEFIGIGDSQYDFASGIGGALLGLVSK